MKLLFASLLAATSLAPAAPPSAEDSRQILRAVFALQVRVHRNAEEGPPPCVDPRIGKGSLGGSRAEVEAWERPEPPPTPPLPISPPQVVTIVNSREVRLSPFAAFWRRPADTHRGYVEFGDQLPVDEEQRLRAAERAAMMAPVQPRLVRSVERAWLGAPLEFCAGASMLPVLHIRSPAITGEFAFVNVDFNCVLCGQGVTFALRRTSSGWKITAAALRWVS